MPFSALNFNSEINIKAVGEESRHKWTVPYRLNIHEHLPSLYGTKFQSYRNKDKDIQNIKRKMKFIDERIGLSNIGVYNSEPNFSPRVKASCHIPVYRL